MKTKFTIVLPVVFTLFLIFSGCTKTYSLVFDVNTNDSIKISSKGYDLKSDKNNFIIYDAQNKKIGEGFFVPLETYKSLMKEKKQVKVIKEAKKNNNPYFLCPVGKN